MRGKWREYLKNKKIKNVTFFCQDLDSVEGEGLVVFRGPKEVNLTLEEGEGFRQSNYSVLPKGDYRKVFRQSNYTVLPKGDYR